MAKAKTEAPAALKLKTCKAKVRRGSKQETCARQYLGADKNCPEFKNHLLPMPTGFCSSGWHEGSKAVDWRGQPAPTCKYFITCPCTCHDELGKLFEMTESDRILVDVSGYQTPPSAFVMPDPVAGAILSMSGDPTPPRTVESVAPDRVPTRIDRPFTPTPTGRAARGQLEAWVREQTDIYLVEEFDFPCTPQWISSNIGHDKGITPPSVGAVTSVLERWVKLGFAVVAKKPTRFTGYTEEGVRLGLERMKADLKRQEQINKANARRGIR